jgi:hypothetical protein
LSNKSKLDFCQNKSTYFVSSSLSDSAVSKSATFAEFTATSGNTAILPKSES